jgi:hypothetical protein
MSQSKGRWRAQPTLRSWIPASAGMTRLGAAGVRRGQAHLPWVLGVSPDPNNSLESPFGKGGWVSGWCSRMLPGAGVSPDYPFSPPRMGARGLIVAHAVTMQLDAAGGRGVPRLPILPPKNGGQRVDRSPRRDDAAGCCRGSGCPRVSFSPPKSGGPRGLIAPCIQQSHGSAWYP